jgi:acetyl esterase/lipase
MSAISRCFLAVGLSLVLCLLMEPASPARAQKSPAVPEDVVFQTGIEYTNPDNQHLKLNLARPKKGDGPFPAILCIHGGGFRAGKRESYDGLCIRLAQHGYFAVTVFTNLRIDSRCGPSRVVMEGPRAAGASR